MTPGTLEQKSLRYFQFYKMSGSPLFMLIVSDSEEAAAGEVVGV